MKKYDCSKVLDYARERGRLCSSHRNCNTCPLKREKFFSCTDIRGVAEIDIKNLQKWSDEHPEKTRAEAFLERVPSCTKISGGERPRVCWAIVSGTEGPIWCGNDDDTDPCDPCTKCWSQPYNGEFEKEGK